MTSLLKMSLSGDQSGDGSRTFLWCVPRTVSTALSKCLSFRDEIEVWFEPYMYSKAFALEYKHQTGCDIPMEYEGNEEFFRTGKEMLKSLTNCSFPPDRLPYGSVKHRLEATTAKHVFVKDMAHAMTGGYRQYIAKGYRHTFLIRHPVPTLFSYRKMMYKFYYQLGLLQGEDANEESFDLERHDRFLPPGCYFTELYDLWKYFKNDNVDGDPIVIDAVDLQTKPAETLRAYCSTTGLPFDDTMLQWDSSSDSLTKMKAASDDLLMNMVTFYDAAIRSSCFLPPNKFPSMDQLPADVIRCSDKVMKYYEEMYETRLIV